MFRLIAIAITSAILFSSCKNREVETPESSNTHSAQKSLQLFYPVPSISFLIPWHESFDSIRHYSPCANGTTAAIYVRTGDTVHAGDRLFSTESPVEASQLKVERVKLKQLESELVRYEKLVKEQARTPVQRDSIRNEVMIKRQQVKSLEQMVTRSTIRARSSGVVLNCTTLAGEFVDASDTVVTIGEGTRLIVSDFSYTHSIFSGIGAVLSNEGLKRSSKELHFTRYNGSIFASAQPTDEQRGALTAMVSGQCARIDNCADSLPAGTKILIENSRGASIKAEVIKSTSTTLWCQYKGQPFAPGTSVSVNR